ncbi:MAG: alkaline phosphatase D family protein, partial [Armatimonadetes bacterium]|nr:alkaline phosphatase D family protein [Armatimonadota bacterium]
AASNTRWNVLGQQVMMARFNYGAAIPVSAGGPNLWNVDQWDGYGAARQRLLNTFAANPAKNVVVLTGDIHSAWVHDLKADFLNPNSATVATEFVCSSITADFPSGFWAPAEGAAAFFSPWTKYLQARKRGYSLCTVTQDTFRTDFKSVTSTPTAGQVVSTTATVTTDAAFVVQNGTPGAVLA